jgi:hypothetical protein
MTINPQWVIPDLRSIRGAIARIANQNDNRSRLLYS